MESYCQFLEYVEIQNLWVFIQVTVLHYRLILSEEHLQGITNIYVTTILGGLRAVMGVEIWQVNQFLTFKWCFALYLQFTTMSNIDDLLVESCR